MYSKHLLTSNDNKYLSYLVSHYLDYCYNINNYE